jgi:hypothetical protein
VSDAADGDEVSEYAVPLTFWAGATVATKDISYMKGTESGQDYNTLYTDGAAFFHTHNTEKLLNFHVKSQDYAIVGIMLYFRSSSTRPEFVSIKGRKYLTKADRMYHFPLMPHEVRPGAPVQMRFPRRSDHEIAMQGAAIFVVKTDKLRTFLDVDAVGPDWIARPVKFDDFEDPGGSPKNPVLKTCALVASAIVVSEEDVIDPQLVESLVTVLYQKKEFSVFARSALIRILRARPEVLETWVETLRRLLEEEKIGAELWSFVWRDFSLLPKEYQSRVQDLIWKKDRPLAFVATAVSAFLYNP